MTELLHLESVSKTYARGERRLRVLADLSLAVGQGEVVAIVGSRGEGKTTLLEVAAGIERPDRGRVLFEGLDMALLSDRERSALLGGPICWITRAGPGVRLRVRDSVAMPLAIGHRRRSRQIFDAADDALERVGASACSQRLWSELSNWEQVLVGFARALVARPRLLIVDDLFEGLGIGRLREASLWLRTLSGELGCGALVSASDVDGTLAADRVWSLADRRLEAMSTIATDAEVIEFPSVKRRSDRRGSAG